MHIAIDITPLSTEHKTRGIGSYAKNLIEALQKYEKKHSYTFFTRGQKLSDTVDLVHYPYFDPFYFTLPIRKTKPTVVTVHDLIPLVFPGKFPPGIKGLLKWRLQKFSLMGAKRIIADSEQSREDIARLTHVSLDRIDVVYLAPGDNFRLMKQKKDLKLLTRVQKRYQLPEQFILYVGDVNWNKNILGMLEAFQGVKSLKLKVKSGNQELKQDIKLVLVGKAFVDRSLPEANAIQASINAFGIRDKVIMPGFVPFDDLPALYSLASVYVQPSFYEGFGLPVLEAMACGCPVVCSYVASLREIGGPAISVDPNDPENIASGIFRVVSMTKDEKEKLVRDGLAWAKKFSWGTVAAQTVASYEKALA